jgi:hypothetical protein
MKRLFVLRSRRRCFASPQNSAPRPGHERCGLRGHLWRAYILRRFSISNSNGSFLTLGTPPRMRAVDVLSGGRHVP